MAILRLSAASGWPVLADPRSGLRGAAPDVAVGGTVVAMADCLLRSTTFASSHRPDVVVRLGERWASKVVGTFLADAVEGGATEVVVDPWWRWIDPERSAGLTVVADPTSLAGTVADRLAGTATVVDEERRAWGRGWRAAEEAARRTVTTLLGAVDGPGADGWAEAALAHRVVAALPSDGTLVVSSSMPVRDVEAFAVPSGPGPQILSNRGANGIDGVVSTAVGVALASAGPTVALVGDLAFLHDLSALVRSAGTDPDLTVVVADNGGGGIFSFLPPATRLSTDVFEELFGTPQAIDVAAVAAATGWPVVDVDLRTAAGAPSLDAALRQRMAGHGSSVVVVRLPGRRDNVTGHAGLYAAVVAAVEAAGSA